MNWLNITIFFVLGLVARVISAIAAGGAGLIEAPILLMLGVPPKITVASRKFAAIGGHATSAIEFHRSKKIDWKIAATLSAITAIGTVIGANILVSLQGIVVEKLIAVMLLLTLSFTLVKKSFGTRVVQTTSIKKITGYVSVGIISIADAAIGVGGGTLSSLAIIISMGLTYVQVSAIRRITGLTIAVISSIIFLINGLIDWQVAIPLLFGSMVGGVIGAKIAVKKGSGFVKVVFTVVVLASTIKILFF